MSGVPPNIDGSLHRVPQIVIFNPVGVPPNFFLRSEVCREGKWLKKTALGYSIVAVSGNSNIVVAI